MKNSKKIEKWTLNNPASFVAIKLCSKCKELVCFSNENETKICPKCGETVNYIK